MAQLSRFLRRLTTLRILDCRANPVEQTVTFPATQARYFKFVAKHALELNHAAIAELGVVEAK